MGSIAGDAPPASRPLSYGDTLQTLAFETLAKGYPPTTAAACVAELARGAGPCGMIGGQVDDMAWEKKGAADAGAAISPAIRSGVVFIDGVLSE